ncbi:unnamed protein product [Urochloa humidicola]
MLSTELANTTAIVVTGGEALILPVAIQPGPPPSAVRDQPLLLLPPLHPTATAAALKEALAKMLVASYPLAGEVVSNAVGNPELLYSGHGADFTLATAPAVVELREIRLAALNEGVEKLVPAKKAGGIVAVKVTKFKCGGDVVGCTFDPRVCNCICSRI